MNFMTWQRIYFNRNFHICVLRYSKQFFAIKKIIFWKLILKIVMKDSKKRGNHNKNLHLTFQKQEKEYSCVVNSL